MNCLSFCPSLYLSQTACGELRLTRSIRHLLTVNATKILLCVIILSKLDFCNPLLSGSPQYISFKTTNLGSKMSTEIPKTLSYYTTPPLQCSLATNTIRNWIQNFDSVLQHLLWLFCCTSLSASDCIRSLKITTRTLMEEKSFGERSFSFPAQWN